MEFISTIYAEAMLVYMKKSLWNEVVYINCRKCFSLGADLVRLLGFERKDIQILYTSTLGDE
jgi:hypothetical protein